MVKPFFITTPIYYVNDVPHIGHTLTTVVADIIARSHKLRGEEVFLLTGTDEHGAKVAEAAKNDGLSPQAYTDKVTKTFSEIWPKLGIQVDYFIRTTNPDHVRIAQAFLQKLYDQGAMYKDWYRGLYCIGCEKFLTQDDLTDGVCPFHPNRKPEKQKEENYFFKLKSFIPTLIDALTDEHHPHHYDILPLSKKNEVLSKLKLGVSDLSISRQKVEWGIPLPWDSGQTCYVWVEALMNYYSAPQIIGKELWPADVHLVGKEILWFHSVIWPALLIAADLPVPKTIFAHSFYMIDGQKMSKSLGNVIAPQKLIEKFGADGTRYLLAQSFPYENDSNVGWGAFTKTYNADLANGWGNVVQRVSKLAHDADIAGKKTSEVITLYQEYYNAMDTFRFHDILSHVWVNIAEVDRLIDQNKPWELAKVDPKKARVVLEDLIMRVLRINTHLKPFMPETSKEIERRLTSSPVEVGPPLFPRVTEQP
ncbi:MAG: methionine--tRNA ligase [bacterium]|nr:methionine--tRNA ligase [bacterium]